MSETKVGLLDGGWKALALPADDAGYMEEKI